MTRGLPDFGIPNYNNASASIDTDRIFLACTGMIPVINTGRPFILDTFHCGLTAWLTAIGGSGVAPAIVADKSFIPGKSLKFVTGLSGAASFSAITRRTIMVQPETMGIEVAVILDKNDKFYWDFLLFQSDGIANVYAMTLRVYTNTGLVQIRTPAGYIDIGTIPVMTGSNNWTIIKLTGDFITHKYRHMYVGTLVVDVSHYDMYNFVVGAGSYIGTTVYAWANDPAVSYKGYLSYVLITTDEP